MRILRLCSTLFALALLAPASVVYGLTYLRPTPFPGDEFGRAVAVLGTDVIVGADQDDTQAPENGVVYRFNGTSAALQQTYLDPTPVGPVFTGWKQFGVSVAALGNDVLVGAMGVDISFALQNTGEVYRFDGTTAALVHTYVNPNPHFGDDFGQVVTTVGGNVLIAAPFDSTYVPDGGIAYLFDGTTGALLQTFTEPVPGVADEFGLAMAAIGPNKVAIAAPWADVGGTDAGVVYVFDTTTGALLLTITSPTPAPGNYFGWSVGAYGNDVLVGAIAQVVAGSPDGAAYRFDGTTGALVQTYVDPAATPGENLGHSITGVGGDVAVGARIDSIAGPWAGAVVVFDANTAAVVQTCLAPVAEPLAEYGYIVATIGNDVLVGARSDSIGAPWAGAAYRCVLAPAVCGNGTLEVGEQCDDGNTTPGDGCSATCQLECGNGVLDPGETCDDGNTVSGDGCSSTCQFEPNFLDHYLCYRVKPTSPFSQIPVTLADVFETSAATVKKPVLLCPPADKNGEGILDPVTHMEGYLIKQTAVHHQPGIVHTLDQFGSLFLKHVSPQGLLVPTNKGLGVTPPAPLPGVADHYKCYSAKLATGSSFTPQLVHVVDQFENRQYELVKPKHFCTPVDKNGEGIKQPKGHLICYLAKGTTKHTKVIGLIHTTNQFGTGTMDTVREAELCVPAIVQP